MVLEAKNKIKIKNKQPTIEKINKKEDNYQNSKTSLNIIQNEETARIIHDKNVEPYKNDINNRFKQLNEKLTSIDSKYSDNASKNQDISEKLNTLIENQKKWDNNNHVSSTRNQTSYHNINPTSNYKTDYRSSIICFHCNRRGHTYHKCFNASEDDKKRLENNLKGQGSFSSSQRTKKP